MPVRNREYFFGRQVRNEPDVVAARRRAAHPQVRRRQADGQIGAGTGEFQCGVSLAIQKIAARGERRNMLLPGGDRIGPIQPAKPIDRVAELTEALVRGRIGKHFRRPRRARGRNHRPVRLVAGNELAERDHAARGRLLERAREIGRLVLQQIGIVGVDRQDGVAGLGMLRQRLGQPRGELAERVAPGVPEACKLQRFVAPDGFHQLRPGPIGAGGDVADERRGLERHAPVHQRSDDQQPLPGLQVESNLDSQLAVAL